LIGSPQPLDPAHHNGLLLQDKAMRNRTTLTTLLILVFNCVLMFGETATPSPEAALRATMAERVKASLSGDSEAGAKSLADEYRQTDIAGYVQDKRTWLKEYFDPLAALIKSGRFHWETFEQRDLHMEILGDCAVVTGELTLRGSGAKWGQLHTWTADPNASFDGTIRFTHVYVRRDGAWLLIALHNAIPVRPRTQELDGK
jgi:ketosteroid isomerase-like protein